MYKPLDYMTPAEKLEVARRFRALLDVEAAWTQGTYRADVRRDSTIGPCYCLLGAGCIALDPDRYADMPGGVDEHGRFLDRDQEVAEFIREAAPELTGNIAAWQDDPTRRWSEVDDVVQRVLAHYEAKALQAALR